MMKGPEASFQGCKISSETEKTTQKRSISTLLAALKECGSSRNLKRGTAAHAEAIQRGLHHDPFVATSLINMYSKCGSTEQAQKVFDQLSRRDAVAWTALITGYVNNGESKSALEIFESMEASSKESKCTPDPRLYVAAISACSNLAANQEQGSKSDVWVEKGKKIHSMAIMNKCRNMFVDNTLLELLAKGGCMKQARAQFESMADRNPVSYTCLIQGYVANGDNEAALEIFEASRERGIADGRIYVAALSACGKLAARARKQMNTAGSKRMLEKVGEIHHLAVKNRCCDTVVENSLIDMFARCGSMAESRRVFEGMASRNVISWTSLLQGYVECGEPELALELLDRMHRESCAPNARTFTVMLSACASAASKLRSKYRNKFWLEKGVQIHSQALKMNCCNHFVENSLLNLYSQCGEMELAWKLFSKMPRRDVVSWNTMIIGLVENHESERSLELLRRMNCRRDAATYVGILKACGNLLAMEKARSFHLEIIEAGLEQEIEVVNSLLDVYSKCGSMELAQEVFNSIKHKTIVSWTTLMFGYAAQGDRAERVFDFFEGMKKSGLKPDAVSFVCLLTACNHAGMVEKGRSYFDSMSHFGVKPGLEHYTCIVDLLGRGKCIEEAWRVVERMEIEADEVVLTAVLAAWLMRG